MSEKGNRREPAGEFEACRLIARKQDYERYMAAMFLPRRDRPKMWALLAFNQEIARTRDAVSEPMIGQIRLQWWREVLEAATGGGPVRAHEVVVPLTDAIRAGALSAASLSEMIEGRERDLDDSPIGSLDELMNYVDLTGGALMTATDDCGARSAMRALGRGWALTGLLRTAGPPAGRGVWFMPRDLLAAADAGPRDVQDRRLSDGVRAATSELVRLARRELAMAVRTGAPADRLLTLKPVAETYLSRLEKSRYDLFGSLSTLSPLRLQWIMLAAHFLKRGI